MHRILTVMPRILRSVDNRTQYEYRTCVTATVNGQRVTHVRLPLTRDQLLEAQHTPHRHTNCCMHLTPSRTISRGAHLPRADCPSGSIMNIDDDIRYPRPSNVSESTHSVTQQLRRIKRLQSTGLVKLITWWIVGETRWTLPPPNPRIVSNARC
jgi:hypothetical protein